MRLLLWDCDDRCYSFYIEVSINQRNWEMVCNKSRESCKSWQTIRFKPLPVVYIRIVGTNNSANEVFHCVHFECPSQSEEEVQLEVCDESVSSSSIAVKAELASTSRSGGSGTSSSSSSPSPTAPVNKREESPLNPSLQQPTTSRRSVGNALAELLMEQEDNLVDTEEERDMKVERSDSPVEDIFD